MFAWVSCGLFNTRLIGRHYSQAHLAQLVLQSQQQVGERAERPVDRLPVRLPRWIRGRWRDEVLLKVFLCRGTRPVQRAHSFTQLRLVVLHHVKDALYVGVNWMARARRLWQARGEWKFITISKKRKKKKVQNIGHIYDLLFLQQRAFLGALGCWTAARQV